MGRHRTSPVWDYFTRKTVEEGGKFKKLATCNICKGEYIYSNNTTNQLGHLQSHHKDIYDLIAPLLKKPPAKKQKIAEEDGLFGAILGNESNAGNLLPT
jgi:BED zinc finger